MKIVLVGHGMVGHKFLESLSQADLPGLEVTVLCEEPRPAYDRVHLSEFFSGKTAEQLSLVAPGFFERTGYTLKLGARAASVDRRARTVTAVDGSVHPYDRLVLATGSSPFVPPVPGRDRPHCFVYRTIEDLEAMKASGAKSSSGVVVGGGLLGLHGLAQGHRVGGRCRSGPGAALELEHRDGRGHLAGLVAQGGGRGPVGPGHRVVDS